MRPSEIDKLNEICRKQQEVWETQQEPILEPAIVELLDEFNRLPWEWPQPLFIVAISK